MDRLTLVRAIGFVVALIIMLAVVAVRRLERRAPRGDAHDVTDGGWARRAGRNSRVTSSSQPSEIISSRPMLAVPGWLDSHRRRMRWPWSGR